MFICCYIIGKICSCIGFIQFIQGLGREFILSQFSGIALVGTFSQRHCSIAILRFDLENILNVMVSSNIYYTGVFPALQAAGP